MTKHPIVISSKDWDDLIGIQFALGGQDRNIGLNCYGLVREVYKLMGEELPERTEEVADDALVTAESRDWIKIDEPRPYAVALMRVKPLPGDTSGGNRYHLGIITPDMRLLHVLRNKGSVVSRLDKYAPMIAGYYVYAPGRGECLLPAGDGAIGKIIGGVLLTIVGAVASVFGYGIGAPLMKIGIGMVIGGVIEGIASMFTATTPQIPDKSGETTNYAWDGIFNNFRQGAVKGMLFGTVKVGGQIISEKTWFDGENREYLDMLICPAVGKITRFSDIKINDTSVAAYENCTAVFRPGDDEQTPIDMFNKIYIQYLSAAKLSTGYTTFSSKSMVGGIRLQITAPNGLYKISKSSGNASAQSVEFKVQYKSSTIDWTDIPTGDPVYGAANPFFNRIGGVFTGTANPYTLTDTGANFDDQLSAGDNFILITGATTYYCTATATAVAEDSIELDAFTDSGRTTPATGAISTGDYTIGNENIHYDISTSDSWRQVSGVDMATGFSTDIACQSIKFTVEAESDLFSWMRLKIWYRPTGGAWVAYDVFDAGAYGRGSEWIYGTISAMGRTYRTFDIRGLTSGTYQVVAEWVNDSNDTGATRTIENIGISNVYLDNTYVPGVFTIVGDSDNPMHTVAKTIELLDMTRDNYDFRVWRTTADASGTTRQDGVYLRGYAEIIDRNLAYPGHALMGIRAMATDRLYGGRPTITSIATGAPLSVPSGSLDTTVTTDNGIVAGTGNLVNGINVDGMRSLTIAATLPAQTDGKYYWLVRMDSAGYADPSHLLTKWVDDLAFCRDVSQITERQGFGLLKCLDST